VLRKTQPCGEVPEATLYVLKHANANTAMSLSINNTSGVQQAITASGGKTNAEKSIDARARRENNASEMGQAQQARVAEDTTRLSAKAQTAQARTRDTEVETIPDAETAESLTSRMSALFRGSSSSALAAQANLNPEKTMQLLA